MRQRHVLRREMPRSHPGPTAHWPRGQRSSFAATGGSSDFRPVLLVQRFEYLDVVVIGIVPVTASGHVFDQVANNGLNAVMRMEAENILGALNGHFVVANVLDLLEVETDPGSQFLLYGQGDQ